MNFNYSTMNNNWMNLFQQGLGMFGINNTFGSFGSFNPMSMNGSLFNYNVNYDAMAGMAVANAVLGVTGQAISSSRAEKQAEKQEYANNSKNLENIQNEIEDLKDIVRDDNKVAEEIDSKYDKNIGTANTNYENLEAKYNKLSGEITGYENDIKDIEKKLAETNPAPTEEEKKSLTDKKAALEKKKDDTQKMLDKINLTEAYQEIEDAKNAKAQAIKDKKAEINERIEKLEKEVEKLQKEVDSYDLDAANGTKLSRTSDKEYEKLLDNDGNAMKNQRYSKADVKTAVDRFMQAVDDDKKMQAAKNLVEMFENCPDWTESLQKAAKVAQRYINEHKNEA